MLDPVSVHASDTRCDYARELLELKPTVIRGNSAEIKALLGQDTPEAAWLLAQQTGAVVAQTGEADIVTDGSKALMIANGHLMQTPCICDGLCGYRFCGDFPVGKPACL